MRRQTVVLPLALAAVVGCGDADPPTAPRMSAAVTTAASEPLAFRSLSSGQGHTCGLTFDDLAYCWGMNDNGALGDGTALNATTPVPVAGGHRFRQISAGSGYTCGVTPEHEAWCWGGNWQSRLGDGTSLDRLTPVQPAGSHRFRAIVTGFSHTCGVTPAGEIYCWGMNRYGQLGDASDAIIRRRPVRVAGSHTFRQVTLGSMHTCATTTSDRAFCWGRNLYGELGFGRLVQRNKPWPVADGLLRFEELFAGGSHSCGIATDGRTLCWGLNADGQLGDGTTTTRLSPVAVVGGPALVRMELDDQRTCGVTADDRAFCWGWWDGSTLPPVEVPGGMAFRLVTLGYLHSCGLTPEDRAYCWGNNQSGQLGNGTSNVWEDFPVPVLGP